MGFILNSKKQSYYINAFIEVFGSKNLKSLYIYDRRPFSDDAKKSTNLEENQLIENPSVEILNYSTCYVHNLETITRKFMNLKHLCVYVMGTIETTYYDFSHLEHLEYLEIVNHHPEHHILPINKNQKVSKDL